MTDEARAGEPPVDVRTANPATPTGRRLLASGGDDPEYWEPQWTQSGALRAILAIEREAAAPALDVDRLARAT